MGLLSRADPSFIACRTPVKPAIDRSIPHGSGNLLRCKNKVGIINNGALSPDASDGSRPAAGTNIHTDRGAGTMSTFPRSPDPEKARRGKTKRAIDGRERIEK